MHGAGPGCVRLKWMAEAEACSRGTKPSSLAKAYVRAVAVIATPHSPGIWCSSGSRSCLLPCPPCCETHYCPGAGSHGTEPSWPTCVCPYPISQLWQLCVWRDKVCVCVCLCVLSKLIISDYGKAFSSIKACSFVFGENPMGIHLFWDLLRVQPIIARECILQPSHNITNDRGWRSHDDCSDCHFAFQKQFLQVWDRQASPFHKRHVIHQPIDLQETWKRKHSPSHYSCVMLWICQYFQPCCLINILIFKRKQLKSDISILFVADCLSNIHLSRNGLVSTVILFLQRSPALYSCSHMCLHLSVALYDCSTSQ